MTDAPDGQDPMDDLTQLADMLSSEGMADFDEMTSPFFWPGLSAEEVEAEWDALRVWVERFRMRFPHSTRIPDCWYLHGDLVEALSALRDHERGSFSTTAPPSGAVEWHRAFRDLEARYENWIKRFECMSVAGRGHGPTGPDPDKPAEWAQFVKTDVDDRNARQLAAGLA